MTKTLNEHINEIKNELKDAVLRLKQNIESTHSIKIYGTVWKVIIEQGQPIRVLVEVTDQYRPNTLPEGVTYLFGAPMEKPLKGAIIELLESPEYLNHTFGANWEDILVGHPVSIFYKRGKINTAKAKLEPKPGTMIDLGWAYKPESCPKQIGKYGGF